ncbi:hypothetical protein AB2C47_33000 [Pseudomonas aeruginosa]
MQTDMAKIRRESLRWLILLTLNNADRWAPTRGRSSRSHRASTPTPHREIRRELDYLADRDLVTLVKEPSGKWFADLTRYGTDVAEYTIDCEPGIARPKKYW